MKYKRSHFYNPRILLVDDNAGDITLPHLLTSQLGYTVTLCFDGVWALETLRKRPHDLIILDWNMPFMNGLQFLEALNKLALKQASVIIHSGQNIDPQPLNRYSNLRIIDIWKKPMGPTEMLRQLKSLSLNHQGTGGARGKVA